MALQDRDPARARPDAPGEGRASATALRRVLAVQLAVGPVLGAHVVAARSGPMELSLRGLVADWLLVTLLGCALFCWQRRVLPAAGALAAGLGLVLALTHVKLAVLRDWPRWSDLSLLPEALAVLPGPTAAALLLVALGLVALAANLRRPDRPALVGGALLLAAIGLPLVRPALTRAAVDAVFHWHGWVGNDPFSRGIVLALARDAAETRLEAMALDGLAPLPLPAPRERSGGRRNLHVIVAESLTDPRDLGPGFPRASIDPRLARWIRGRALSPLYGAGSAQSEFELLCGLPATAALPDPTVFNGLGGRPAPCLPRRLAARGYATHASVAVEPWFFNARRAYASLGFQEARFAPDLPAAAQRRHANATRTLLRHNRRWLEERLDAGSPLFNYVVTVKPHFPFRGPYAEPRLEAGSPLRTGLATGLRDATRAIADHVTWLADRDPDSVILVVGDHQAPGFASAGDAPEAILRRHGVPVALLAAGVPRAVGLVSHFQLSERVGAALAGTPTGDEGWLRPLPGGRLLHPAGTGVGACPNTVRGACRELEARVAALESRTRRLVAMTR